MSDRRLIPVSPTKLDVWQQCAFRFRLQYVEKVPVTGSWAHLSLGNAVHAALRDWFDDEERTPATGADLVRSHWSDLGFRDPEHSAHWREVAADMVAQYLALHGDVEPHSRERTLGTVADHVTVSGRIDRLDERDGEVVVVDYKTGATVPTADDARMSRALAMYALAVQRSLRRPAYVVQLHHVPSGLIAEHRHDDQSLARQLSRVDAIGRDIGVALASDDPLAFAPNPGPLCGWCDFRAHCPSASAAPEQPRWAGLPEAASHADSFPI
jgi:RecB family exonuclease